MPKKGGLKVCVQAASDIRRLVNVWTDGGLVKLPPNIVFDIKAYAESDAEIHRRSDSEFLMGGGPAVRREGEK